MKLQAVFLYNFVDDTIQNICAMGPPTKAEDIAKKIFNHLKIFQYLEDVREHNKNVWSTFISPPVKLNDNINIKFLKRDRCHYEIYFKIRPLLGHLTPIK